MSQNALEEHPEPVSISPLLKRLAYPRDGNVTWGEQGLDVEAEEIASAFSLIFEDRLSIIQTAAFLTLLHSTRKDRDPEVIAKCAQRMREAANPIDKPALSTAVKKRSTKHGSYRGGLCDIVGTGGDSHSTFNISTTSSIIASPLLLIAKHGNRAQTSLSGSADVLMALTPKAPNLPALDHKHLPSVYNESNYAFLFAPNFHPGMKYAAAVRRGLGLRTIFNLLGPLANPVEWAIEARLVGVAYQELGPIFAEALRISGATKALVVCGEEDLDEISCAGRTTCWMLKEVGNPLYKSSSNRAGDDDSSDDDAEPEFTTELEKFSLQASDFGLSNHPLSEVGGGKLPKENAAKLMAVLRNELKPEDTVLEFVLMNVAALLVISGTCDADTCETGEVIKERGPGGGRWKEGVRKARWCLENGRALQQLEKFIHVTNSI